VYDSVFVKLFNTIPRKITIFFTVNGRRAVYLPYASYRVSYFFFFKVTFSRVLVHDPHNLIHHLGHDICNDLQGRDIYTMHHLPIGPTQQIKLMVYNKVDHNYISNLADCQLVLRHQIFCQYFNKSFANNFARKIESFKNCATFFKISAKIVIS